MEPPVLTEAKKYLDTVDFIIDLYDKTFVWATDKVIHRTEYSPEEFKDLQVYDTLDETPDAASYSKILAEQIIQKHGTTSVLVKSKTGKKMRIEIEYYIFQFDNGLYRAGKGLNIEVLP